MWLATVWLCLLVLVFVLAGCVRSITTCVTYDRALRRPDPNTGVSRDSVGASVCTEITPPGAAP